MASTNQFTYAPIPLPPSANPKYFTDLGRRVEGFDPSTVSDDQMAEIVDQLYKVGALHETTTASEPDLAVAFHIALQRPQAHTETAVRHDPCKSDQQLYSRDGAC